MDNRSDKVSWFSPSRVVEASGIEGRHHTAASDAGVIASIDDLLALRSHAKLLSLSPNKRLQTLETGTYRSLFSGRGMEFAEVRDYRPGDDIRTIDWRVTARRGRVHTKLFHEERERPVILMADLRAPMHFGTRRAFKSVVAARIAALLAWTGVEAGDRVGGLVFSRTDHTEIRPRRDRRRVLQLLNSISQATHPTKDDQQRSLADMITRLDHVAHPGSFVALISDFHDFDTAAERHLVHLRQHCDVMVVYVHDPLEQTPPPPGLYTVSDGHNTRQLNTGDNRWRKAYRELFSQRRSGIESFCSRHGIVFAPVRTDDNESDCLRQALFQPGRKQGSADPGVVR